MNNENYQNPMKKFFLLFTVAAILEAVLFIHLNKQISEKGFVQILEKSGVSVEGFNGGVTWGDYNADGFLDLLIRNQEGYGLYRNNHNETFTDVTLESGFISWRYSSGAIFGDYDNDGCQDIYLMNGWGDPEQKSDLLYRNNCNGTFTDVSSKAGIKEKHHARGVAWGDYNNDGLLDIYVATFGVLKFIKTETSWTVVDWVYESNILYHNNGDGTFTNISKKAGVEGLASCKEFQMTHNSLFRKFPGYKSNWQPVWFDYDNDGLQDLYVSNETTSNSLYHNNGDGTFTDVTEKAGLCTQYSTHGVAVGDYDSDGYFDIVVAGSHQSLFWHNNGNGTFTNTAKDIGTKNFGLLSWGVGSFDYDNDGYLDIYFINGSTSNASNKNDYPNRLDNLYKNNGRGKFSDVAEKEGLFGNDAKSFGAFGDFNNDGFTDVFVLTDRGLNSPPTLSRLYRNTPNGNHWLTIKLIGTKSTRDGVGVKITAEIRGKKQFREVISGASLMSQNSILPTFGLGHSRTIDTLTIRWPSDIVQTFHNVKSDRIFIVKEE